jgi:hypothetical protein
LEIGQILAFYVILWTVSDLHVSMGMRAILAFVGLVTVAWLFKKAGLNDPAIRDRTVR